LKISDIKNSFYFAIRAFLIDKNYKSILISNSFRLATVDEKYDPTYGHRDRRSRTRGFETLFFYLKILILSKNLLKKMS